MKVGSDTGGTFTDIVTDRGEIAKVLSTPEDPSKAVESSLGAVGGLGSKDSASFLLAHGTTVATNAILERRGAVVALITNEGFLDLIEIGRQDRPSLYDLLADRPEPLVPRDLRYGVSGRLDATGQEIEPLNTRALMDLLTAKTQATAKTQDRKPESVAICLLHSDLNPAHEHILAKELSQLELAGHEKLDVSCSADIAPEFREYERLSTVVMNAYLKPLCRDYLNRLLNLVGEQALVMTSAGGLVPMQKAIDAPVRLLLSGPAGGVRAGAFYAETNGYPDAVTLDMGGTSTDICLISDGKPAAAGERYMAGLPVKMPALDVLTIGAGGGSIAQLDAGGALLVGPESAGGKPGPACYGLGGKEPTVTDANLLAGHIDPTASFGFGQLGELDTSAAQTAFESSIPNITPLDVISVVNANMEQAIKKVTIDRGVDTRNLALVAFGGAGPLHACDLAESLQMRAVIVPPRAGVLSAVGILGSAPQIDRVVSWPTPNDTEGLESALQDLAMHTQSELLDLLGATDSEITCEVSLDCRYAGQSHEINTADLESFHAEHERRNGYAKPDWQVEVVALRAKAIGIPALDLSELPVFEWDSPHAATASESPISGSVFGPVVLSYSDTTIWIPENWQAELGAASALILTKRQN